MKVSSNKHVQEVARSHHDALVTTGAEVHQLVDQRLQLLQLEQQRHAQEHLAERVDAQRDHLRLRTVAHEVVGDHTHQRHQLLRRHVVVAALHQEHQDARDLLLVGCQVRLQECVEGKQTQLVVAHETRYHVHQQQSHRKLLLRLLGK